MNNGEVIQQILFFAYGHDLSDKENQALDMAIKALAREERTKEIIWNNNMYDGQKICKLRNLYPC